MPAMLPGGTNMCEHTSHRILRAPTASRVPSNDDLQPDMPNDVIARVRHCPSGNFRPTTVRLEVHGRWEEMSRPMRVLNTSCVTPCFSNSVHGLGQQWRDRTYLS